MIKVEKLSSSGPEKQGLINIVRSINSDGDMKSDAGLVTDGVNEERSAASFLQVEHAEHKSSESINQGFLEELSKMKEGTSDSITSGTPLLHRVAILDQTLDALEDKYSPSARSTHSPSSGRRSSGPPTPSSLENHCKPAQAVLEETEEKGSLLERVASLEKKVTLLTDSLQRSLYNLPAVPDVVTLLSPPLLERSDSNRLQQGSHQLCVVEEQQELTMRRDITNQEVEQEYMAPESVVVGTAAEKDGAIPVGSIMASESKVDSHIYHERCPSPRKVKRREKYKRIFSRCIGK